MFVSIIALENLLKTPQFVRSMTGVDFEYGLPVHLRRVVLI